MLVVTICAVETALRLVLQVVVVDVVMVVLVALVVVLEAVHPPADPYVLLLVH